MPSASPRSVLSAAESQWFFTLDDFNRTPSVLDGMPLKVERENRGKGVHFITQVGIMLKLPQMILSTANIFLHRFFMRFSMVDKPGKPALHYYAIAATALFLATKVEENCRKMKELVIACCRIAQKNPALVVDEQSKEYWRWRDTILHNEDLLLEALCFDLSYEPPYKIFFDFLNVLGEHHNKEVRNSGWTFLNDSSVTMLCLLYPSRVIAASALYCSARSHGYAFADHQGRPWWEVLGVRLLDIKRACNYMASVYNENPTRNPETMYVHTPEDDNPFTAKTRARASMTPVSPTPSPRTGVASQSLAEIVSGGGANGLNGQNDELAAKRPREAQDHVDDGEVVRDRNGDGEVVNAAVDGGEGQTSSLAQDPDGHDAKRRKTEGTPHDRSPKDVAAGAAPAENGVAEPDADAGSEEGEVES